jgi:rfaE bifunctional protein nucleotidyltransferase chain/domain/rfaE bifunctional protein kinase chain/domain
MSSVPPGPVPTGSQHLAALTGPLAALEADSARLDAWGRHLAGVLSAGGRLLVAGNGGSAAQAQHLSSELVGRFRDERRPFSAIALCTDASSFTAIANDYGVDEVFARQVRAHGRPGDVLVVLSTSGRSANVIAAARAAREIGLVTWGLTGPGPNPLLACCDDAVVVDAATTATIQEVHQVVVHLLCASVEVALTPSMATAVRDGRRSRVVVIGDALLDRDLDGTVERVCPDAPVPVLEAQSERARPGGAALAATLAAAGGTGVTLITALAADGPGRVLSSLLAGAGVEVVDLVLEGPTPEKVRVRAGGQSLLRIDHGAQARPVGPISEAARSVLAGAAAVLVADYGRGVAAEPGLRQALAELAPHTPLVWDPHPRGPSPVPGARLVTPNQAEAKRAAAETGGGTDGDGVAAVTKSARRLAERWQAGAVAVTMGAKGALLAGADGPPLVVPAPVTGAGDTCGAGDRFAAGVVVALANGAVVSEAVEEGVRAASAFVAAGGVDSFLADSFAGIASAADAFVADAFVADALAGVAALSTTDVAADGVEAGIVARVRARGGLVVATGGCFDLLHAGHLHMLQAARALGDCLVVLLNSDDSVRRLKGPDRPLQSHDDRAAVLAALDCVDQVVVFEEDTPVEALERLRPDLFAKGADYAVADLPEAHALARWGGEAVVLPYLQGRSTTRLIEEAVRRAP